MSHPGLMLGIKKKEKRRVGVGVLVGTLLLVAVRKIAIMAFISQSVIMVDRKRETITTKDPISETLMCWSAVIHNPRAPAHLPR